MDNCWISCQVMADMKKVYDDLIIINLYDNVKKASICGNRKTRYGKAVEGLGTI